MSTVWILFLISDRSRSRTQPWLQLPKTFLPSSPLSSVTFSPTSVLLSRHSLSPSLSFSFHFLSHFPFFSFLFFSFSGWSNVVRRQIQLRPLRSFLPSHPLLPGLHQMYFFLQSFSISFQFAMEPNLCLGFLFFLFFSQGMLYLTPNLPMLLPMLSSAPRTIIFTPFTCSLPPNQITTVCQIGTTKTPRVS